MRLRHQSFFLSFLCSLHPFNVIKEFAKLSGHVHFVWLLPRTLLVFEPDVHRAYLRAAHLGRRTILRFAIGSEIFIRHVVQRLLLTAILDGIHF